MRLRDYSGRDVSSTSPLNSPMTLALLAASFCLTACVSAPVGSPSDAPMSKARSCRIGGWSSTPEGDGRTVAVYANPSFRARVSGTMPTDDESYVGPKPRQLAEFDIVETRNGWFRIANVRIIEIRDASYDAYASKVTGWIQSSSVRFNIQSSRGFAGPSSESALLVTSPDWIMERWMNLYDCDGQWAQVETEPADPAEKYPARELPQLKAWFRGICGLSMIGCDNVAGD